MKARRWVLMVILMLAGVRLMAQEATPEVEYRLRVPTAEEYINAIPSIWENRNQLGGFWEQFDFDERIGTLLIDEFEYRYFDTVDAQTLSDAYERLNRGIDLWSNYQPFLSVEYWNMEIVRRQLAATSIELPDNGVLIFDRYHINSEKHDFDSDGKYEWVLHVERHEQYYTFEDYWIARLVPRGGYEITYVPLPFADSNFWPAQENSLWAGLRPPDFRDVNADGIVEWIASTSTVEPSSNARGSYHTYYILGWRNNRWDIITAQTVKNEDGEPELRTVPPITHINYADEASPGWRFENIDQDEPLEFVQYQEHTDEQFDCKRIEQSQYDWNGEHYMLTQHSNRFNFSPGCLSRIVFDLSLRIRGGAQQITNAIHAQVAAQPTPTSDPQIEARYTLTRVFNLLRFTLSDLDRDIPSDELKQIVTDPRYRGIDSAAYLIPTSQYYYALALESRNRPDEALAEYVAIYEAAPESAWGMLAALHLERVE